ncbi:hypothetical protein [Xanthomonas euvesicatoria]|nr:hypothetical protein [Xanthomonas euvesicatoria]
MIEVMHLELARIAKRKVAKVASAAEATLADHAITQIIRTRPSPGMPGLG